MGQAGRPTLLPTLAPVHSSKTLPQGLGWPAWAYGLVLPLVYWMVELSFTRQLLLTLGDHSPDDVLSGFEFWGRLISGCGLGVLLHRLIGPRLRSQLLALLLSLATGMALIWWLQKTLIDHWVATASLQDKQAALVLVWVAPHVSPEGLRTLEGLPLLDSEPLGLEKNIVVAMFPAAALHTPQRELQFAQWLQVAAAFGTSGSLPLGSTTELADQAYRALIVAPLVVGLSLLFAMVNLSLALSFLMCTGKPSWRPGVAAALFIALALASLGADSRLVDAQGYQRGWRSPLWQEAPLLAAMVEGASRSATLWAPASEKIHRHILRDYRFAPLF